MDSFEENSFCIKDKIDYINDILKKEYGSIEENIKSFILQMTLINQNLKEFDNLILLIKNNKSYFNYVCIIFYNYFYVIVVKLCYIFDNGNDTNSIFKIFNKIILNKKIIEGSIEKNINNLNSFEKEILKKLIENQKEFLKKLEKHKDYFTKDKNNKLKNSFIIKKLKNLRDNNFCHLMFDNTKGYKDKEIFNTVYKNFYFYKNVFL